MRPDRFLKFRSDQIVLSADLRLAVERRQFFTMRSPDVIADIKQAGIEDQRAAWEVMEKATRAWLKRRKARRTS